ncbi:hypothetical protein NQ315_012048 [Exocentrus adspersus]|uniref:Uncharacterized protein n=1 Tax=Exocentrus adspersus TaxID=1586481 RepID=A0AAV8VID7_9CUCU|nr:hypothetical protein NQ315_012048 [Exocentrus adspersus]
MWEEAKKAIRDAFASKRPPYKIYIDLFSEKQDIKTLMDTFLCHKRALLAELPENNHTEEQQINLIFGLLHSRIRARIHTENINTFDELLKNARKIEESHLEERSSKREGDQ